MKEPKPISDLLDKEERHALEALYTAFRVATDQLRRAPDVLQAIAEGFERTTSRRIDTGTLLRYMLNRRKAGNWPKLGKTAQRFGTSLLDMLPAAAIESLKQVYVTIDIPLDEYLFRRKLVAELERRFATVAGSSESGDTLVAVMMALRKRGLWPTIREATAEQLRPFGDIDDVVKRHAAAS